MSRVKVSISFLGEVVERDRIKKYISKWRSDVFSVEGEMKTYSLDFEAVGEFWNVEDWQIQDNTPRDISDSDIKFLIVSVPLEGNYYCRRLNDNFVAITLHQIEEYLENFNIPIENYILRQVYEYCVIFKRWGKIPATLSRDVVERFTHDETRGCLFDMNGIKSGIRRSCIKPIICDPCKSKIKSNGISDEFINLVSNEIRKIDYEKYYKINNFIKKNVYSSVLFSILGAILIGMIASLGYDVLKYFIL